MTAESKKWSDKPLSFCELVDIDNLQKLCENFTEITNAAIAVVDLDGNTLITTGPQKQNHTLNIGQCKNGLRHVAEPLNIDGHPVASFVIGPFFGSEQDKERFCRQAKGSGLEKETGPDAVEQVLVLSGTQLQSMVDFFTHLVSLICESGHARRTLIAEREQAELARSKGEGQLRSLMRTIPDLVWLKDIDGVYLTCNTMFERFFGVSETEIIGKTDYDFVDEKLADFFREHDRKAMASEKPSINEEWITFADDGHRALIETIKTPMSDADGEIIGVLGIARDITERKRTEELLARQNTALVAAKLAADTANKAKSEFLASMSHELRTPLNAILGYAQLLKRDPYFSERQLNGINTIQQSGQHLLTLINDLLDMAKIEAGKFELSPAAVDLDSFLTGMGNIIRIKASEKGLQYFCEADPGLPRLIWVDEKRLCQMLLNLLSNAVKFTRQGSVKLHVECLSKNSDEACIRFDITDTGVGLTDDDMARLFHPFEQAGDSRQRAGGTGLGLAISRRLASLMDSDICLESHPHQGSRFWFDLTLPIPEGEIPGQQDNCLITGYTGPRKKVLIVDDVDANRALLNDLLDELGFELYEAGNGQEAIEQVGTVGPDLVLMDVVMPVMGGLEAIRLLRRQNTPATLPIIVISASATTEEKNDSLAAGANAFLSKPIERTLLLNEIGHCLQLVWQQSEPLAAVNTQKKQEKIVIPPQKEMHVLYELARTGNMRAIRTHADYLTTLDENYQVFADQLQHLAQTFQSKAILRLVEAYMNKTDMS